MFWSSLRLGPSFRSDCHTFNALAVVKTEFREEIRNWLKGGGLDVILVARDVSRVVWL